MNREQIKLRKNSSRRKVDDGSLTDLDKATYHEKMDALLSDTNTYKKLPGDPTASHRNTIIATMAPMEKYIPTPLYKRIFPTTTNPPRMFGQPKIHKPGLPMRPIVSARDTIFSELTREAARIITPLVGKSPHHLRDSVDLKDKLKDKIIPPDFVLVSFDLVSMFTNIPQADAINIVEEKLTHDATLHERTPIKANHVVDLIRKDLELAYFQWKGEFYAQPKGLGMGKSTSSPLSDLFMEQFEQEALANYDTGNDATAPSDVILFWLRKADVGLACTVPESGETAVIFIKINGFWFIK